MKKIQVAIYYNKKLGFIFFPFGKLKNGPRIIIGPAIKKNIGVLLSEIDDSIMECLHISEDSLPLEKSEFNKDLVLDVSGIKSHTKFNNTYDYLVCEKRDGKLYLIDKKNDIEVQLCGTETDRLGKTLFKMLPNNECIVTNNQCNFKTAHNNIIKYTRPSDQFEDRGDGYTDAYQIYTDENNDNNYIMFVIDNLYDETSKEVIKKQWEKWYGELEKYEYGEVNDDVLKVKIYGKSDKEEIASYLYQDGDALMEVTTKIDFINTTKEQQKKIKEEFEKVISSIKIILK